MTASEKGKKKTYDFRFSEADYWSIYEPIHQQHGAVWMHPSTRLIALLFIISSLAFLIFSFSIERVGLELYAALGVAVVILGTAYIYQTFQLQKAKTRIKDYFESIRGGISLTVDPSTLQVKMGSGTTIFPWTECKQARIDEKYIQIDLHNAPPVLIPVGKESKSLAKEFETHISEISAEIWGNTSNSQPT